MQLLVKQVAVGTDSVRIRLRTSGLTGLINEFTGRDSRKAA